MKKVWLLIIMILFSSCLAAAVSVSMNQRAAGLQREIADEVIRFHVRANSESEADQQIKMQVKNAVISYLQPVLENTENISEAKAAVLKQLSRIKQISGTVLSDAGYEYGVNVSFQKERFPEKSYGSCTFPAGVYSAVVVSLGKGAGHNWWCMLYPGLCFVEETYAVVPPEKETELRQVLTEDAYELITEPEGRNVGFRWTWLDSVADRIRDLLNLHTGNP